MQFPDIDIEGMFTELMRVVEFPPGSSTGQHVHNGLTFLLVLEGSLTLIQDGGEMVYEARQSWTEMAGHVREAVNNGDSTVRLFAIYLLPMTAPATAVQQ